MNTIVVNLFGGQGSGKSTTMAGVFSYLKSHNVDCEMCTEFAKELVWENRQETFKDELYIFSKQNHRLFRCNGKVKVVVTDRPLIMTTVYNREYGDKNNVAWNESLDVLVFNTWSLYNNQNFYLRRVKPYNSNGRNESEAKAREFDVKFKDFLNYADIPYVELDGDETASQVIGEYIVEMLRDVK